MLDILLIFFSFTVYGKKCNPSTEKIGIFFCFICVFGIYKIFILLYRRFYRIYRYRYKLFMYIPKHTTTDSNFPDFSVSWRNYYLYTVKPLQSHYNFKFILFNNYYLCLDIVLYYSSFFLIPSATNAPPAPPNIKNSPTLD